MAIIGGRRKKDFTGDPQILEGLSEGDPVFREGERDGGRTAVSGGRLLGRFRSPGAAAKAEQVDKAVKGTYGKKDKKK